MNKLLILVLNWKVILICAIFNKVKFGLVYDKQKVVKE